LRELRQCKGTEPRGSSAGAPDRSIPVRAEDSLLEQAGETVTPFLTAWTGLGDDDPDTGCRCRGLGEMIVVARGVALIHRSRCGLSRARGARGSRQRRRERCAGGPGCHLRKHVVWHLRRPLRPLEPRQSCRPCRPSWPGTPAAPPAASLHHQPALRALTSHHPGRPTSSPRRNPDREARHLDCSCAGWPTPASATSPGSSTPPRRPHGPLPDRRWDRRTAHPS